MADEEQQAVRRAADGFYAALEQVLAGDAGAMAACWSHADDVTYMGPRGGFQVGWAAVHAEWQGQAAGRYGGSVRPHNIRVTVGDALAFVQSNLRNVGVAGPDAIVDFRATLLLRKEAGVWKTVGVHTDLFDAIRT